MRSPKPSYDLRAALSAEVTEAAAALDAAPKRKAIHQCRIRLKRARTLARIGRACAPGLSAVFNDSARAVMRQLAGAREAAALAEVARGVAATAKGKRATALNAAARNLELLHAAMAPTDITAVRAGIKDLSALAQVWPECSARQLAKGAARVARKARRARRRGRGAKAAVLRHDWRKREKDRFYAVSLLGDAWPEARRRKLGEKLGDALGHERDVLLLIERIEAEPSLAGDGSAAERALEELRRRRKKLARAADALGEQLHAGGA